MEMMTEKEIRTEIKKIDGSSARLREVGQDYFDNGDHHTSAMVFDIIRTVNERRKRVYLKVLGEKE